MLSTRNGQRRMVAEASIGTVGHHYDIPLPANLGDQYALHFTRGTRVVVFVN